MISQKIFFFTIEGFPKFDIFPQIYALFCRILSRQTFTHFFKSRSKKFATYMFKTGEGGGQRPFKQCLKKLHNWHVMASLIRRLLNCSKELPCSRKKKHLNNYMQLLKNSGYSEAFIAEILKSGINGYNKILKAEKDEIRPIYLPKGWKESARWMEKRRKKNNFWKSCIFVPPTPGS